MKSRVNQPKNFSNYLSYLLPVNNSAVDLIALLFEGQLDTYVLITSSHNGRQFLMMIGTAIGTILQNDGLGITM